MLPLNDTRVKSKSSCLVVVCVLCAHTNNIYDNLAPGTCFVRTVLMQVKAATSVRVSWQIAITHLLLIPIECSLKL